MRDTIIRLMVLLIVLANQYCVSKGYLDLEADEETIYGIVSCIATIVVSAWCYWKNNSFTKEAIESDKYMKKLKEKNKKKKKNAKK